jgi:biopolymer transport protein ExbB
MIALTEIWITIRDFLETGGGVLYVIFAATFILWSLIVERFWFFNRLYPQLAGDIISKWEARSDKASWNARQIREATISETSQLLKGPIYIIKTLVTLCPLLGLLGTVTGMIAVFEVMAMTGTGNARLMAGGISMATIPTMAGMVAALSGIYFGSRLEHRAKQEKERLEDSLPYQA